MAKNNKNQIEAEPVVKYDQLGMEVTKCDLQNINIESLIHIIRGQKVMFDSDLAMLYGVETRTLNQAVKRNITRFPDDFMFQVTKEEFFKITNCDFKRLEITNCDIKLGWHTKTSIRFYQKWNRHAQ